MEAPIREDTRLFASAPPGRSLRGILEEDFVQAVRMQTGGEAKNVLLTMSMGAQFKAA